MSGPSRTDDPVRPVRAAGMALAAVAIAVAHAAPAMCVLPALAPWQPRRVPGVACRWRGRAGRRQVAVTFDDGPSPDTVLLLEPLRQLGMPATFFLTGQRMESQPDVARELRSAGHQVGLHGFRHEHHLLRSPRWVADDLDRAVAVHRRVLGETPRWFRPPYGQLSAATVGAARRLGLETVLWSTWGREFADPAPDRVLARLVPRLTDGAVVLLHDSDGTSPPGTAAATRQLLPLLAGALARCGLTAVTLDELVAPSGERPVRP